MHPELADLLRNARRLPATDPARLVLADWLEEHGNDVGDRARANFIRLQARAEGLHHDDPLRPALLQQAEGLRRPEWSELPSLSGVTEPTFRGGLLRMGLGEAILQPRQHRRLAEHPAWEWVDGYWIDGAWSFPRNVDDWLALLGLPVLAGRGTVGFPGLFDQDGMERLADCPALRELRCLRVCTWPAHSLGLLLRSEHLGGLDSLEMDNAHLTGLDMLAEAGPLRGLTRLELYHNDVQAAGITALDRAVFRLAHLGVAMNNLGVSGVEALLRSPHAHTLRSLDLSGNGIGDRGAALLAASPRLPELRYLSLGGNGIGDRAALALAESPYLAEDLELCIGLARFQQATRHCLRARFRDRVR